MKRTVALALLIGICLVPAGHDVMRAQASAKVDEAALAQISETDLRQWLTTLAADEMLGRGAFTEGYGLAAGYVTSELARMGVEPLGAGRTYLHPVVRQTYRVTRRSSITVEANGETRTFVHGEHVSFPLMAGSRQTLRFSSVLFAGYGLPSLATPEAGLDQDVTGRLVVFLPGAPADATARNRWPYPRALMSVPGRTNALVEGGAGAAIGYATVRPGGEAAGGQRGRTTAGDLVTVQRIDRPRRPVLTADEAFFEFLLAAAPAPFAELRARANRGEPLSSFALSDVRVTIDVDNVYESIQSERTHNVVGIVRGSDAALRETYVLFGAHLDHVGTASGSTPPGRTNVPLSEDAIWNGADDNASGSAALLGVAKAMVEGPRPRRSTVFIWHAAEEEGLLGSMAMADDPVVPLDRVQAAFNIDMVGRNHDDDPGKANTVYVVGADRISTDLHNLIVDTNARGRKPLTLDYHYNDPADPESFYTRSDHYSYAVKGIPVAFFFTGTHRDYHANTDTVDKIEFPKLTRIAELIYEAGFNLADNPQPLRRDNLGPRSGRGFQGRLPSP